MTKAMQMLGRMGLWTVVGVGVAIRVIAMGLLPQPIISDALAYQHMADGAAHGGTMVDTFGQYAFYSPGYPLLLAGPFALLGSHLWVAEAINLLCAATTLTLVYHLGLRMAAQPWAAALAALGVALWLPSILECGVLAKENLSVPLLLAFALGTVRLGQSERPLRGAALLGALYGFSLLVGGSVILTAAGFGITVLVWQASITRKMNAAALFGLGAIAVLTPWLWHVRSVIGVAMLSSNAPFNLYLGNNPAATGWFVSIMDTPLGPIWHQRNAQLGEAGTAAWLNRQALNYITSHPLDTLELALRKLAYFWYPHAPHIATDHPSRATLIERGVVDAQYLIVLVFGLIGMVRARVAAQTRLILITLITAFWLIHGVTYILPRYHEPVMPLLTTFAAVWLGQILDRKAEA